MILHRTQQIPLQATNDDTMVLEGYAIKFNSPTVLYTTTQGTELREIILPTALDNCDMTDVILKYNHNNFGFPFARTKNNTLILTKDNIGLHIKATLISDVPESKTLYNLCKNGTIDKMSFAFRIATNGDSDDYSQHPHYTRKIHNIAKIYDVSAVDVPAYDDTSIHARQLDTKLKNFELIKTKYKLKGVLNGYRTN